MKNIPKIHILVRNTSSNLPVPLVTNPSKKNIYFGGPQTTLDWFKKGAAYQIEFYKICIISHDNVCNYRAKTCFVDAIQLRHLAYKQKTLCNNKCQRNWRQKAILKNMLRNFEWKNVCPNPKSNHTENTATIYTGKKKRDNNFRQFKTLR